VTAPACPRLAAELTRKILDVEFTDEIKVEWYSTYIWLMNVLLDGGWADFSDNKYTVGRAWLQDRIGMWDALEPWLTDETYTEDDVAVWLVGRALFDTPVP